MAQARPSVPARRDQLLRRRTLLHAPRGYLRAAPIWFFASGVVVGNLITLGLSREAVAPTPMVAKPQIIQPATVAGAPAQVNVTVTAPLGISGTITDEVKSPPPPVAERKPSRAAKGFRGSLVVNSQPRGASVFINNELAGRTPLVVKSLPAGSRAVRVRLDGYSSWSRAVRVVANQSTTVLAELSRVEADTD